MFHDGALAALAALDVLVVAAAGRAVASFGLVFSRRPRRRRRRRRLALGQLPGKLLIVFLLLGLKRRDIRLEAGEVFQRLPRVVLVVVEALPTYEIERLALLELARLDVVDLVHVVFQH